MKKIILVICMAVFSCAGVMAQNEVINNETVLQLLKEKFSTQEIIGAIDNSTQRQITFSLDYMRQLKEAGADATLTNYIQKIAKTDYGYEGILWWNTGAKPTKIYRSQFEKEDKSFNLGTIAAAGVVGLAAGSIGAGSMPSSGVMAAAGAGAVLLSSTGKDIQKLVIMGLTSKNVVKTTTPVFRFYLPKNDQNSFSKEADSWYRGIMNGIQSPNEFQVIKMEQKKNRRRFTESASYSIAGFEGTNSKDRVVIDFNVQELNNNTFEITFPQPLEPGEYVFFWKNGLSSESFRQHVFGFDFCVKP